MNCRQRSIRNYGDILEHDYTFFQVEELKKQEKEQRKANETIETQEKQIELMREQVSPVFCIQHSLTISLRQWYKDLSSEMQALLIVVSNLVIICLLSNEMHPLNVYDCLVLIQCCYNIPLPYCLSYMIHRLVHCHATTLVACVMHKCSENEKHWSANPRRTAHALPLV